VQPLIPVETKKYSVQLCAPHAPTVVLAELELKAPLAANEDGSGVGVGVGCGVELPPPPVALDPEAVADGDALPGDEEPDAFGDALPDGDDLGLGEWCPVPGCDGVLEQPVTAKAIPRAATINAHLSFTNTLRTAGLTADRQPYLTCTEKAGRLTILVQRLAKRSRDKVGRERAQLVEQAGEQ
jgi:hypothetical protein